MQIRTSLQSHTSLDIRALGRRRERRIYESIDANANCPDRVGEAGVEDPATVGAFCPRR